MPDSTLDKARISALTSELGYTGITAYGGYLQEEWLRQLHR